MVDAGRLLWLEGCLDTPPALLEATSPEAGGPNISEHPWGSEMLLCLRFVFVAVCSCVCNKVLFLGVSVSLELGVSLPLSKRALCRSCGWDTTEVCSVLQWL